MSVASAILARSELDSFWKLAEAAGPTYADEVGGVSGTQVNAPAENQPSIVPGTSETSMLFNRANPDAITFTNVYDFPVAATFTAYGWFSPTVYDSANGHFFWSNRDAAARGWSLHIVNSGPGNIAWQMARGDNAGFDTVNYDTTEAEYESGVGKQVAMSYDGTNLVLNYNGVDVASGASSKSLVAATTDTLLNFGRYGGGGSGYTGYAQYLAIFSPNLVEADLAAIYAGLTTAGGRRIYQRLYGPAQLGTSAADLYTVPDGARVQIRSVWVNNPTGGEIEYTLSIGNDAGGTRFLDQHAVPAGEAHASRRATHHTLVAGEKIQGFSDSTSAVVIINGYVDNAI